MIRIEQVVRLVLDGAEIIYDRGSQRWHLASQIVRKQTFHKWEKNGYLGRDFPLFKAADTEYYKLTKQGWAVLNSLYLPK